MVTAGVAKRPNTDIRQIALSMTANDPNQIFLSKNGESLAAAFYYFSGMGKHLLRFFGTLPLWL
jgi:hypothetical protein